MIYCIVLFLEAEKLPVSVSVSITPGLERRPVFGLEASGLDCNTDNKL